MQNIMIKNEIIGEIKKLCVAERLNIAENICEGIKESDALEPISDEEKSLLFKRLSDYRENPDSAVDWRELKKEVYGRYFHK